LYFIFLILIIHEKDSFYHHFRRILQPFIVRSTRERNHHQPIKNISHEKN